MTASKIYFVEEFVDNDQWKNRWISSEHESKKWEAFILSGGNLHEQLEIGKGLRTSKDGSFYAISTKFKPFTNKDKTFVLQYSVKHEQNLTCGGAYVKVYDCNLNPRQLHQKTSYLLMFGPDFCSPHVHKIHVIFNYRGKLVPMEWDIRWPYDKYSHLYTLIIYPNKRYTVKIDNLDVAEGTLEDDWKFLPPKKIENFKARKPKDWDENFEIYDPSDQKPDDWDQPEYIFDKKATKPDDWNEDIDGAWEPPLVKNPAFKGPWKPRKIRNANYKGPWIRPFIDNPDYFDDPDLYVFEEICGIGIDVWQVESGTIFDNILISDDPGEAEEHGWKIWGKIREVERKSSSMIRKKEREHHVHDEL
ncbi:calreticulin-like [Uloborus diversus]|uniref:calreticulin-like n=1 Tax=Uloborus diversus TaxID=327109 RepID=UPI002409829F|nr:calreticulin-like [Uloborus diversus]